MVAGCCRDSKKWTLHHLLAFLLTFCIYGFLHACRKSFSNVKDMMEKSLSSHNSTLYPYTIWQKERMFTDTGDANVFLGELDFLFLLAYAIGLYFSGYIGDRVNLRVMLTVGMCGSALMTFAFGYLSVKFQVRHKNYYRIIYFMNGLFQSTGWPITVTIIGNWFSKSSAGLVFGFWSTNSSIGNILGSLIVACVIDFGYEYGMLLNSYLLLCGACVIAVCLVPHPNDIGLPSPEEESPPHRGMQSITDVSDDECELMHQEYTVASDTKLMTQQHERTPGENEVVTKPVGFIQACLLPGVGLYALSFACLKMVNYSFFFWLPTYLSQGLHWDDKLSDRLSNFYDVGQIGGGIVTGVATDIMGKRSPIVCAMLALSMVSIYAYSVLGTTVVSNMVLMTLTGLLVGGPSCIISTAITADLGKHETLRGNAKALGTVAGIIDGTGSVGAAVGQYLVGVVSRYGGWKWVFYFLVILQGVSLLLILPVLVREVRRPKVDDKMLYKELLAADG